jgi:demethylmenaquinone methyltransferase/2-methoxy-6-polyprenyl-1,4-benzoquinol methylase
MHSLARRRSAQAGLDVELVGLTAERLPLPDESFDTVVCTYTLCSIDYPVAALREVWRVLKPGGKLMVLEFSKVAPPLTKLYDWYSFQVLPRLGKMVAGDDASYRYLAESIRMHPDQTTLKALMQQNGFAHVDIHNMSLGVVALHVGIKC